MTGDSEKDESVQQVEENLNQKLTFSYRLRQGLGMVYKPKSKFYPTIKQNLIEGWLTWFTVHKGYRFVGMILVGLVSFLLAYFSYPFLLVDIFLTPVIALITLPFAREAAKKRRRTVHSFRRQKRVYPVGMKFDDLNTRIDPIMFEDNVTGHHAYSIIDEAISDTPKPDSIQLLAPNSVRDYITNKEELIVEYVSPDGRFAAGNPYSGYSNLTLLEITQKPRFMIAPKFRDLLTKLNELPADRFEDVYHLRESILTWKQKLRDLQVSADAIVKKANKAGFRMKSLGNLEMSTERFLLHYTEWMDRKFEDYKKFRETPESATLPAFIEKMNNGTTNMYTLQTIWLLMNEIQDRSDMKARDVRRKINKVSQEELLRIANEEGTHLRTSTPPAVEKQVIEIEKKVNEEPDEEDNW